MRSSMKISRVPPSATAPSASSFCHGTPILRTSTMSSGALRRRAISAPIATPPRGRASTTGDLSLRWRSCAARRSPASLRSRNIGMPHPRHRHCKPNSSHGTIDRHACITKRQIGPQLIERHVADETVVPSPHRASRLHYAWIVAAVTFVVVLLTAGVRSAPSVLIVPLEEEFHWSRATISFAVGVNLLLYGLVGPFAAALMDRFGVRRTTTLALAATALGVALSPAMHEPWQLILLWGVAVGIGCGFIGAYLGPFIAVRWFHQRQGVVIGVLTAASAAGQLVFLPTMAALVTYAGWRVMSLSLGAIVMVFVPLVLWLMRERPEDLGLAAYGGTHTA